MKKLTWALLAAAALTLLGAPSLAQATETPERPTVEVFWATTNTGDVAPTAETVEWPQKLAPTDSLDCEVWYQVDTYYEDEAALFTADGVLTQGEDYQTDTQRGAISWYFVQGPECEEEVIPPVEPETPPVVPETLPEQPVVPAPEPVEPELALVVDEAPELAETGFDGWSIAGIAATLILAGGAIKLLLRRKVA